MLNQLKNHELTSYFNHLTLHSPIEWLDLHDLRQELRASGDQISDEQLEILLYGTGLAPIYSGFTEARVKKYADAKNLSLSASMPSKRFYRTSTISAVLPDAHQTSASLLKDRLKRREQRRQWKAALVERYCRYREKFSKNIFNDPHLKLNLGAGSESHSGYVKVDWAGPQHIFDDIVTLQRIKNASVAEIYSNHVLEHIPTALIPVMLKRWHDILKPGGSVRLRMPDARQAVMNLGGQWSEVGPVEIEKLGFPPYLSKENTFSGEVDDQLAIQFIYGWSDSMPGFWDSSNQHKSLWTPALGKKRLEDQGFKVSLAQNFGTLQTILIAVKAS